MTAGEPLFCAPFPVRLLCRKTGYILKRSERALSLMILNFHAYIKTLDRAKNAPLCRAGATGVRQYCK